MRSDRYAKNTTATTDDRKGRVFILNPSKRCEPSAFLFSRAMKFFLVNGYAPAPNIAESDIILVNSCCVTEDKIAASRAALEYAAARGKGRQIVLFGCLADLPFSDPTPEGLIRIGPGSLDQLDRRFAHRMSVERIMVHRLSPAVYEPGQGLGYHDFFVMIAGGCVNRCSYCNIKRVKGHVRSRSAETILSEIRQGLSLGAKEFVLLADDCASYGQDRGTDLTGLMETLFDAEDHFRVKLGYLFPQFTLTHFDRLKKILETGRVAYVNIPVQSGSQRILDLMNRRYPADGVKKAVGLLRAAAPETCFCTHVMINFPTESEKDFMASLDLAEVFETVLFLDYSDNRGTGAAQIHPKVAQQDRLKRLDLASDWVNHRRCGGGAVIHDFNCDLPYNLSRGATTAQALSGISPRPPNLKTGE